MLRSPNLAVDKPLLKEGRVRLIVQVGKIPKCCSSLFRLTFTHSNLSCCLSFPAACSPGWHHSAQNSIAFNPGSWSAVLESAQITEFFIIYHGSKSVLGTMEEEKKVKEKHSRNLLGGKDYTVFLYLSSFLCLALWLFKAFCLKIQLKRNK